jgi:hypothetical protein
MRLFHVTENPHGGSIWSVDEIILGHSWTVAHVEAWTVDPACRSCHVSANGLGFIKIECARVDVADGHARFL